MIRHRILLILLALTLSACAKGDEEFLIPEPVMEEPVLIEEPAAPIIEAPVLKRADELCPQSGDGIGGTGCPASDL